MSTKSRAFTCLTIMALLLGCESGNISIAKESIRTLLKDAPSARFEDVVEYSDGVVCGKVNAKNAMGGYTGFESFVFLPQNIRLPDGSFGSTLIAPEPDDVLWYCSEDRIQVLSELLALKPVADAANRLCEKSLEKTENAQIRDSFAKNSRATMMRYLAEKSPSHSTGRTILNAQISALENMPEMLDISGCADYLKSLKSVSALAQRVPQKFEEVLNNQLKAHPQQDSPQID